MRLQSLRQYAFPLFSARLIAIFLARHARAEPIATVVFVKSKAL